MEQARLIWDLQAIAQEEYVLQKKEGLKSLVVRLKQLQDSIKRAEEESSKLGNLLAGAEAKATKLDTEVARITKQAQGSKDKLYQAKGGSLKELLSLQQSLIKMEEEVNKSENRYMEVLNEIENLKKKQEQVKEIIKSLKKEYNEGVKEYKKAVSQLDFKLAELKLKREEIEEQLSPETLRLYTETERRFPRNAVAKIKGGTCSGCHISIPSVLVLRIKEGKTLQRCDNCGRILINIP
ncbi:MAG: zinc ribbon domain-containing protein [Bacillota bacterium]|uniref:Uncharacterized protein n=1 Tax=Thermanaerosceptrum fracticalcis TaxID=1712410 RepID=A0A7G6E1Z9_THEFR|nr:C4-type zinc ribbon domain-containing protein [Thermanaerosceptrum fracticalcis]QNB46103.1 hypothetical protein BR63_07120 [Thermanaerosceptrum fracticalcis]